MNHIKLFLKSNKGFLCLWLLLSCIGIILQLHVCSDYSLTFDSTYQYALTSKSFPEIFALLPEDYSPPLYAVILKLISLLFGEHLLIYRFFNGLALSGMLWLCLYPVRRAFGIPSGLLSALLILCSAFSLRLFNDIRPTYLAGFFVTGLVIYGWLAFFESRRRDLICFTLFAVLCMYTHNIALVAAFGVYITCLLCALICRDRKKFLAFLISGVCCVMIYLPWLFILIRQIQNVSQHYWEGADFTLMSAKLLVFDNIFRIEDNNMLLTSIIDLLPRIGAVLILLRYFRISLHSSTEEFKTAIQDGFKKIHSAAFRYLFLALELIIPLIVFAIINQNFHKLVITRYFFILTGVAILIMIIPVAKSHNWILYCSFSFLVLINFGIVYHALETKMHQAEGRKMVEEIRAAHPDGKIAFLHSHEWTLGIMMYFFPDAQHYIYQDTWTVLTDLNVFPSEVIQIGDPANIWDYTDQFYYFPMGLPDAEILEKSALGEHAETLSHETYSFAIADTGTLPDAITLREMRFAPEEKN